RSRAKIFHQPITPLVDTAITGRIGRRGHLVGDGFA
ncbi:MAG: hypothetical protein ACI855_005181, partial [Myxococcota bacterium]